MGTQRMQRMVSARATTMNMSLTFAVLALPSFCDAAGALFAGTLVALSASPGWTPARENLFLFRFAVLPVELVQQLR
jgi:hypothetical protein